MQASEKMPEMEGESESHCETQKSIPKKQATAQPAAFTFNDMGLRVGDKLQIKLLSVATNDPAITAEYCIASLIGYYGKQSLIISSPSACQSSACQLVVGDKLELYFFSGKTFFRFISYVEKINAVPFKYLHLSFPTHIAGQTIRNAKRINVHIAATINANNPESVIVSDISETGARIKANKKIGSPKDTIELTIESEKALRIKATIRTFNRKNTKDYPFSFGIEFTELQQDQTQALQDLIHQQAIKEFN